MQHLSSGMLQKLQQQGETQTEATGGAEGGTGAIPSRQESSTSVLLSGDSSRSVSASSPVFLQTPTRQSLRDSLREEPRESSPGLLGRRGLSRSEFEVPQGTSGERSEVRPRATTSPSWTRTAAEVPSQLLGWRAGTDASLRRVTPESSPESIQQYNSDMRALLVNSTLMMPPTLTHDLTSPRQPSPQPSHHSISSISSISSEGSYASSFAYSLRRSKPDLRLLRKSSKPSQHLKPKTSVLKAPANASRSPSFYRPKVVEDTRVITLPDRDLTPLPLPESPASLTLSELLKADPTVEVVHRVQTFGSGTKSSERKSTVLKPAISRPALSRATSSRQFTQSAASAELPKRPPAKPARQLRFESPHGMYARKPSPSKFAANSHLHLADSTTPFNKNSHLTERRQQRHYHDVTPPEDEPGRSDHTLFRHDDAYFHTFGADTKDNRESVPAQERSSGKPRSVVQVISAATPRKSAVHEEHISKTADAQRVVPHSGKRASSALFGLFRKNTIKEEAAPEISRTEHKRPEVRRFSTPETSARPMPSPDQVTPVITLDTSTLLDNNEPRKRSIVPELRMPSYFARPKVRRFDSEWSVCPSPGHVSPTPVSPGTAEAPYSLRSRREHRSSSEALSPTRMLATFQVRRHGAEMREENDTESYLSLGPLPHGSAVSTANDESQAPPSQKRKERIEFLDSNGNTQKILARQETILKRKASMWKGVMHGLRKMSSVGFLDQQEAAIEGRKVSQRYMPLVMPKISLPKISLRASRSSISVRNGRLVRKTSRGIHLQRVDSEEASAEDEVEMDRHHESQSSPEVPVRPVIRPEDLIVTEFEQTPFSKRYYDAIRAEQQTIRALMDETIEEDDEADDEIVLGFEQNVPDHLPNSPLCPLSPKHKSGGRAICPLHGKYKRRKSMPSPQHKVEIVFDTREELVKGEAPSLGGDGTEPFLGIGRLDLISHPSIGLERHHLQESSMGSDGTKSIMVQLDAYEVWSQPRRRRFKQRSSDYRGRSLERGESALDRRQRQRRRRRDRR